MRIHRNSGMTIVIVTVLLVTLCDDSLAQDREIRNEVECDYARPGDLIVRHGKGILGPPVLSLLRGLLTILPKMNVNLPDDIPHVGMLLENGETFDLQIENVGGRVHGIIHKSPWYDSSRYKNPGFFSVLESNIPIEFQGKRTTFRDLPSEVKAKIRENVVRIAEGYVGRDMGEYSIAGAHCGDATMQIYEEALNDIGITVLRYKGLFAFMKWLPGMRNKGLVKGKLRDWFINDLPTLGKVMDPSEFNDKLPRVGPSRDISYDAYHANISTRHADPFQPIPVANFSTAVKKGRVVDGSRSRPDNKTAVLNWDSTGTEVDEAARKAIAALQRDRSDTLVLYGDADDMGDLAKAVQEAGYKVKVVKRPQPRTKTDIVAAGMGLGGKKPHVVERYKKERMQESGVSMQMDVNDESVQKDETGELDARKKKILENRPQTESLFWPASNEEDDK